MENNNDEEVILNTQEDVDSEPTKTDESSEESIEEYKARLAKAEELANNYKIRAEKAEKKNKEPEVKVQPRQKDEELSTMDIITLSKSNVDSEDMGEVVKWARYNNITIGDALKSPELNAVISVRKEMRTTASATNTGGSKRSSGRVSDETLISNASKGNIPESDEDLERLVRAKMQKRN